MPDSEAQVGRLNISDLGINTQRHYVRLVRVGFECGGLQCCHVEHDSGLVSLPGSEWKSVGNAAYNYGKNDWSKGKFWCRNLLFLRYWFRIWEGNKSLVMSSARFFSHGFTLLPLTPIANEIATVDRHISKWDDVLGGRIAGILRNNSKLEFYRAGIISKRTNYFDISKFHPWSLGSPESVVGLVQRAILEEQDNSTYAANDRKSGGISRERASVVANASINFVLALSCFGVAYFCVYGWLTSGIYWFVGCRRWWIFGSRLLVAGIGFILLGGWFLSLVPSAISSARAHLTSLNRGSENIRVLAVIVTELELRDIERKV